MKRSKTKRPPHRIGLRERVFLEVGAIIVVCIAAVTIVNSQLLESVYLWNEGRVLRQIADSAEAAGVDYNDVLSHYEQKYGVSVDLYDSTDNYLYKGQYTFISSTKLNVISRQDNKDGSYLSILQEDGSVTQYMLYGKDFQNGEHIEVISREDPIKENASLATRVTTVISVAALILTLLFIYLYSLRFTKPLISMSGVTSKMSRLDFSEKCKVARHDEIGALAENINTLSDSLDTALTELKVKNEQLTEDIEQRSKLEKMRQDFVSSASHELKTPIAIIRGYAEGLKMDLDPSDTEATEYCDIIMSEADKMNELVLNLLEMSLYTSGVKKTEKEPFELSAFVIDFLKKARPLFEEKGITVSFANEGESLLGYGDEKALGTVLSNLVSNAVSHASGEKKLVVSVCDAGKCYRVAVFNTGEGIREQDREKLFMSFYRADQAHSRSEGRFGLGLSIVKTIMDQHGNAYGFNNRTDGVEFWFDVEKAAQSGVSEGKSE